MKGPIAGMRAHAVSFAVALVVGALLFLMFLDQGGGGPSLSGSYEVQAVVPSAVALAPRADVRIGGVRVGRVDEIGARGDRTVLVLKIDDDYAPLAHDARPSVRMRTLVGENYVEIDPGSADAAPLPDGGVIRQRDRDEAAELDEVLNSFRPPTRQRLQRLLAGLGGGLDDRGDQLNALLDRLSGTIEEGAPVAETLASERVRLARLIDDFGHVMRSLESRGEDIRVLARQGRAAATTLASRDDELRAAIERMPDALVQVKSTTGLLDRVTETTAPALEDLAVAVERLDPVVRRLPGASVAARGALSELDRFAPRGGRLLADLEGLSPVATRAFPHVDAMLREFNPLVGYLAKYSREIGAFFATTRSATDHYDATGAVGRIQTIMAESSVAAFPAEVSASVDRLFAIGTFARLHQRANNAYPRPGRIHQPEPFEGEYPRLLPEP